MKRFILATESSCSVSASPVHSGKLIWFTTWPARGRQRTFVADFSVKEKRENKSSLQSTCVSLGWYYDLEIGFAFVVQILYLPVTQWNSCLSMSKSNPEAPILAFSIWTSKIYTVLYKVCLTKLTSNIRIVQRRTNERRQKLNGFPLASIVFLAGSSWS